MNAKDMRQLENWFELGLILFFIILFFLLIKNYILVLFLASTLVFLTYPLYKWFVKHIKSKNLSALLVLLIVIFAILLPIYTIGTTLYTQSTSFFGEGKDVLSDFVLEDCSFDFCRDIENEVKAIDENFDEVIAALASYISKSTVTIVSSVTKLVLNLFIFLLGFFFLLKDGDRFVKYVRRIIPMKETYKNALFLKFKDASLAVFMNSIVVAILQGSLVGLAFWIFGIPSPLFWGVVASFFALVPLVGPAAVWWPGVFYLLLTDKVYFAIALIIYGILVVGLADNIARPYLLRGKMEVHPFMIVLGIIGGIELFGFLLGIFLGPIIVSFLVTVIDLYKLDFK